MKNNLPNLCLGTAQFGLQYGITNSFSKPNKEEVRKILNVAGNSKIKFLDTAESYGNAEELIGYSIRKNPELNFKVISKLSLSNNEILNDNIENILDIKLNKTLENLNLNSLNGYLIHNTDLFKYEKFTSLIHWLKKQKEKKLVKRIGISIYDAKDLEFINLEDFDIVQLPLSIYDQRLLKDETIKKLFESGKAVHVRSLFLQGLLLQKQENWPNFLSSDFKTHHNNFSSEISNLGLNFLKASLYFASELNFVESFLVGIGNIKELKQIIDIWNITSNQINNLGLNFKKWSWDNELELDPRKWPK